jgi:hypothetical protein
MPSAISHLEQALAHAKSGNASKVMHHIGHAMIQTRGMTKNAGGSLKIPSMSNKGSANPMNGPSKPSGNGMNVGGGGMPMTDAQDPTEGDPNNQLASNPAAGSLRARLAGMSK